MKKTGKRISVVVVVLAVLTMMLPVSAVSYHYDFGPDEVTEKTAPWYFSLGRGDVVYHWSAAEFDGAQVLRGAPTTETAGENFVYEEDLSGMTRVIVESRVGASSDDSPFMVGLVPIFKDEGGNRQIAQGVRLNPSGNFFAVNNDHNDRPGVSLTDKLYTIGFVYDVGNHVMKEYYIGPDGSTTVYDMANENHISGQYDDRFVRAGYPLMAAALYVRGNGTTIGPAYWDYLHIDDGTGFAAVGESSTVQEGQVNVPGNLQDTPIDIYYNYVIDPSNVGTATLRDADGGTVDVTVSSYNGHNVRITSSDWLEAGTEYTLTLTGVTDLLGDKADDYSVTFTTADSASGEVALTTNGGQLTEGENTVSFTLTSASASDTTPVTLLVGAFDKESGDMLDVSAVASEDITQESGRQLECTLDTTGYEAGSYYLEAYVWDGIGTMRPYMIETVFE